jgi:hypothetical protein
MRLLIVSLAIWSVAAAAQAAPRNGIGTIPSTSSTPSLSGGQPFKPYKPYSAYGSGSRSMTPKSGPQYVPGYKPYKPPFRERPGLSGQGGTFDQPQGTF